MLVKHINLGSRSFGCHGASLWNVHDWCYKVVMVHTTFCIVCTFIEKELKHQELET
jgi:hypothetical protein